MEKEYIMIEKEDGTEERVVIVAAFTLTDSGRRCIIYKSEIDNQYYAASCDEISEDAYLDTNFTDLEKEQIQTVFDTLNNGGI